MGFKINKQKHACVYIALPDAINTKSTDTMLYVLLCIWSVARFLYAEHDPVIVQNPCDATTIFVPADFEDGYPDILDEWEKEYKTPIIVVDVFKNPMQLHYRHKTTKRAE